MAKKSARKSSKKSAKKKSSGPKKSVKELMVKFACMPCGLAHKRKTGKYKEFVTNNIKPVIKKNKKGTYYIQAECAVCKNQKARIIGKSKD